MVYGVRTDRESESPYKRNFAQLFYWLMKKITNIEIPDNSGDFRLMDRKVVEAFKQLPERTRFMKGLYAWVGFKKIGVPFSVEQRLAGKSSWGFIKLTELAITGITSFSDVPLRVWGFIGIFDFFNFIDLCDLYNHRHSIVWRRFSRVSYAYCRYHVFRWRSTFINRHFRGIHCTNFY